MSAPSIDDYLIRLRSDLAWRPDVDDIVDECADHLWSAYEVALARGLPAAAAERTALDRIGPSAVIRHSFEDGGCARRSVPTATTRLGGLASCGAGLGWIVVGVGWFGAYYRPGWLWGHIPAGLFPALPVLVLLTALGLLGLHLRLGRPLSRWSLLASAPAGAAVPLAAARVDAAPFWSGLLALSGLAAVAVMRGSTAVRVPTLGRALLAVWWIPTTPAQIVLQLASDLNVVVIAAGWSAGFALLGVAQISFGRTLWNERAADRSVPHLTAA